MTVETFRNDPGNALSALKAQARRWRGERLAGVEAIGLAVALGVWIWIPERWPFALPFLALSAFGLWGITDRTLVAGRRRIPRPLRFALRGMRWLVAAAGVIAAAAALYLLFGALLGTVVS